MENVIKEKSKIQNNSSKIIKGSIISIIISAILLLIFAILLCYTTISESTMKPVVFVITGISIIIGSLISTKNVKKNGLVNGGLVGLIYIVILYFISSLTITGFSLNINSIIMILIAVITGMIGGIIGINLK